MSKRKIYEGLPLPGFLRPQTIAGTVLQVEGASKSFGGIRAVSRANLEIGAGQIHALIGPNGAGKTTLFNLISGLFPADAGTIRLNGSEIQQIQPDRICHRGLARSFQITNLFRGLSIYENLRLSLQARHPMRSNLWRDIDNYRGRPRRDGGTGKIPRARRYRGNRGRRAVLWRPAAGGSWHRARLQASIVAAR